MRKAMSIVLCLLCTFGIAQYSDGESLTQTESPLAWLMGLYGYDLPDSVTDEMHEYFTPLEFDCGTVRVTLMEVLYDGEYLYTSARVTPTAPAASMILPASAIISDFVAGGYHENLRSDPRTFMQAALEDQKTLLIVNVHPEEFAQVDCYFLDHRQDAGDQSTVFGGALVGWIGETPTNHLLISIALYDPSTDAYSEIASYHFPVKVHRVGTIGYDW